MPHKLKSEDNVKLKERNRNKNKNNNGNKSNNNDLYGKYSKKHIRINNEIREKNNLKSLQ
jgi:hypothetical protein